MSQQEKANIYYLGLLAKNSGNKADGSVDKCVA